MKYVMPTYYPEFECIAERCQHSCCVGWEIDIDDATRQKYRAVSGDMGERLRAGIAEDEQGAHFRLDEQERCPFLNQQGLCELILQLGKDSLCQICADHPRFRTFYSDRTESGLGLCCEAACALILKRQAPVSLSEQGEEAPTEQEQAFFDWRKALFAAIQDRSQPFDARLMHFCSLCDLPALQLSNAELAAIFLPLERLHEDWGVRLAALQTAQESASPWLQGEDWQCAFEQLMTYLLYRHLGQGIEEENVQARAAFCLLSFRLLYALCAIQGSESTIDDLCEIARAFSEEIEYSDENVQAILDLLAE